MRKNFWKLSIDTEAGIITRKRTFARNRVLALGDITNIELSVLPAGGGSTAGTVQITIETGNEVIVFSVTQGRLGQKRAAVFVSDLRRLSRQAQAVKERADVAK